MNTKPKSARPALALSIGLFLFAVYLLSFRGGFHSVDEVSTFAVTESLVKFGELNTDQIAWTQWTTSQAEAQGFFGSDGRVYSKKGFALSLFQAPLYWLALTLPGVGMLQTVSLLNAILTAATGAFIFSIVRRLGYSVWGAVGAALIFGLATIAWVYAKYLFSGTLAGFLLTATFYFLLVYKQQGGLWRLALAGFLGGLTVVARANNALLLGVFGLYLLVILWQNVSAGKSYAISIGFKKEMYLRFLLWPLLIFAGGAALAGSIFLWYNNARSGNPLQTGYDLSLFDPNLVLGLYKLLFSPLRGLFIYSPVLILALPGWFKLRKKRAPEAWLIAGVVGLTVLLFSAWSSGEGLSWGSRFMVPIVPFLIIASAPIINRQLTQKDKNNPQIAQTSNFSSAKSADKNSRSNTQITLSTILFWILAGLSFLIQLIGVVINPWVYLGQLQAEFGGEFFLERTAALYNFSTSQIAGQLQNWAVENSDLVWWQAWGFDWLAFGLSLALVLLTGWLLWKQVGRSAGEGVSQGDRLWPVLTIVIMMIASVLFLLNRYFRTDLQFGGPENPYLPALNQVADEYAGAGSIITVAESDYHVPMNGFKAAVPIIGFARSVEPLPPSAFPLLEHIYDNKADRSWLITARYAPADPTIRVEEWLAQNAFKATDDWLSGNTSHNLRLARYGLDNPASPITINRTFEDGISLKTVARPENVFAGAILPVELTWQAGAPPTGDYRIFLQLLEAGGTLAAQHDGAPQGGYLPTSRWPAAQPIADRHGLLLPATLPPGEYRLIVGLYNPVTGQRLITDEGTDFVDLGLVQVKNAE